MTRQEAKKRMKQGIEVIRQKHPNGGAFDYIGVTGGIALIDEIYDAKETCEGCSYEPESGQNFPMECSQCRRWYADGYISKVRK